MNAVSFGYDYVLPRYQRALSLLAEWWLPLGVYPVALLRVASFPKHWLFLAVIAISIPYVLRRFISGVLDLSSDGRRHLEIQGNAVEFGRDKADWWISAEGIRRIRRYPWGTTTIRLRNGSHIDIPTHLITPVDMELLRGSMRKPRAERRTVSA